MKYIIRQESTNDVNKVNQIVELAFKNEEYSDHDEHHLINRLRSSQEFVPQLSLVAENNNQLIGHILLTKVYLKENGTSATGLALAPVSVLPEFQGKGVGSQLISYAHNLAKQLGYGFIIVVGHSEYYPRFGYKSIDFKNIQMPFDVPEEVCFILSLTDKKEKEFKGNLIYSNAFFN